MPKKNSVFIAMCREVSLANVRPFTKLLKSDRKDGSKQIKKTVGR